jgi:hypothetical protein
MVTLSIVNYVVHHSNGWAFERKVISNQRSVIRKRRRSAPQDPGAKNRDLGHPSRYFDLGVDESFSGPIGEDCQFRGSGIRATRRRPVKIWEPCATHGEYGEFPQRACLRGAGSTRRRGCALASALALFCE